VRGHPRGVEVAMAHEEVTPGLEREACGLRGRSTSGPLEANTGLPFLPAFMPLVSFSATA
jgi:hypothetical protein